METQLRARAACLEAGNLPIGWKIGFGAPATMQKLDIQEPLLGFLSRSACIAPGEAVDLDDFHQAVFEPEIAVYMGEDLAAGGDDQAIRSAIAGLGPAVELADLKFAPDKVEEILAGNVYQHGVVFGPMDPARAGARLEGLAATLVKDDIEIASVSDPEANTGRIVNLVGMVADILAGFGLVLAAGEVVIAGSVVPPVFVDQACSISYELAPFDPIAVRFN
jgi:2-keto-4-pentenoate hydratase